MASGRDVVVGTLSDIARSRVDGTTTPGVGATGGDTLLYGAEAGAPSPHIAGCTYGKIWVVERFFSF